MRRTFLLPLEGIEEKLLVHEVGLVVKGVAVALAAVQTTFQGISLIVGARTSVIARFEAALAGTVGMEAAIEAAIS